MESIDKVGRKKAARLDLRDLGKAQERKVREREAGHRAATCRHRAVLGSSVTTSKAAEPSCNKNGD